MAEIERRIEGLLERLRLVRFEYSDEGDEHYHIAPPATVAQLAAVRAHLGGTIPGELGSVLERTAGFHGWQMGIDLIDPGGAGGLDPAAFGRLVRIHDAGNGDGLYLDAVGDRCELWWFGHDPWDVIFVSESLMAYLERCVEFAEALQRAETDEALAEPSAPVRPRHDARPIGAGEFGSREEDTGLRAFAADLPAGSSVFDLRRAEPGTHASRDALDHRVVAIRRQGRIVAFCAPPPRRAVAPLRPDRYLALSLSASERQLLAALPRGSLVLHERDMPAGGFVDATAFPDHDAVWQPPFHLLRARQPWWRFW